MSIQELLSLTAPRAGDVDPESCLQCAKIRKKIKKARTPAAARAAVGEMETHKAYGHPHDSRPVASLSSGEPRIV